MLKFPGFHVKIATGTWLTTFPQKNPPTVKMMRNVKMMALERPYFIYK